MAMIEVGDPRLDGWMNILTGAGTKRDRTQYTVPNVHKGAGMDRATLEAIYLADGWGRLIVDTPAQDMLREWIRVPGDTDGEVLLALRKIHARKVLARALRWSRLYGGSVLVVGTDDAPDLTQPLRPDAVRQVRWLRAYDRYQVSNLDASRTLDPGSTNYGLPELYQITPHTGGFPYRVHYTRLYRFNGDDLPDRVMQQRSGWGGSKLETVFEALGAANTGWNAAANIITDFIQSVLSVDGLTNMLAAGQEDLIRKRLDVMDLSRSILNTILIDANGEEYTKHASSVAGLGDLLDRLAQRLSGITGIPMTKFMGVSPAGMNATGESDLRNYYDTLASEQEDDLREPLEWLVGLVLRSREGPQVANVDPESPNIEFNPLMQPSESELATTRKTVAEADAIYIDRNVLMPEEVAVSRFGGEQYSLETVIEDLSLEDRRAQREADEEAARQAAEAALAAQQGGDPGDQDPGTGGTDGDEE